MSNRKRPREDSEPEEPDLEDNDIYIVAPVVDRSENDIWTAALFAGS